MRRPMKLSRRPCLPARRVPQWQNSALISALGA
jgi:hypothetical protein